MCPEDLLFILLPALRHTFSKFFLKRREGKGKEHDTRTQAGCVCFARGAGAPWDGAEICSHVCVDKSLAVDAETKGHPPPANLGWSPGTLSDEVALRANLSPPPATQNAQP